MLLLYYPHKSVECIIVKVFDGFFIELINPKIHSEICFMFVKKLILKLAESNEKYLFWYVKLCNPSGIEYAAVIKKLGLFYSMGDNCSIIPDTYIGNASYIRMGNNVRLASCTLLAHDGVINMLENTFSEKLDAVGKIEIGDNVFIGHKATVLRGVTIGSNCVIAAGAVVVKDVPENSVVGGVPAKVFQSTDELYDSLLAESKALPWYDLIKQRKGGYDPKIEPALYAARIKYFFGDS